MRRFSFVVPAFLLTAACAAAPDTDRPSSFASEVHESAAPATVKPIVTLDAAPAKGWSIFNGTQGSFSSNDTRLGDYHGGLERYAVAQLAECTTVYPAHNCAHHVLDIETGKLVDVGTDVPLNLSLNEPKWAPSADGASRMFWVEKDEPFNYEYTLLSGTSVTKLTSKEYFFQGFAGNLAIMRHDQTLTGMDVATQSVKWTVPDAYPNNQFVVTPDGKYALNQSDSDSQLELIRLADGFKTPIDLGQAKYPGFTVAVSPKSDQFLVGYGDSADDTTFSLSTIDLEGHATLVSSQAYGMLDYAKDGRIAYYPSANEIVIRESGRPDIHVTSAPKPEGRSIPFTWDSLRFSQDGDWLETDHAFVSTRTAGAFTSYDDPSIFVTWLSPDKKNVFLWHRDNSRERIDPTTGEVTWKSEHAGIEAYELDRPDPAMVVQGTSRTLVTWAGDTVFDLGSGTRSLGFSNGYLYYLQEDPTDYNRGTLRAVSRDGQRRIEIAQIDEVLVTSDYMGHTTFVIRDGKTLSTVTPNP